MNIGELIAILEKAADDGMTYSTEIVIDNDYEGTMHGIEVNMEKSSVNKLVFWLT